MAEPLGESGDDDEIILFMEENVPEEDDRSIVVKGASAAVTQAVEGSSDSAAAPVIDGTTDEPPRKRLRLESAPSPTELAPSRAMQLVPAVEVRVERSQTYYRYYISYESATHILTRSPEYLRRCGTPDAAPRLGATTRHGGARAPAVAAAAIARNCNGASPRRGERRRWRRGRRSEPAAGAALFQALSIQPVRWLARVDVPRLPQRADGDDPVRTARTPASFSRG